MTAAQRTGRDRPRDRLDRERVILGAMELADERGIDAVSMRELGRRLGVEAASLYNHVAGKDDLLDGMVERVVVHIEVPSGADWQDAMRRRAISARAVFSRHPWAAALIDSRGSSGAGSLSYADRVLGVLLDAGFSPGDAANAFLTLDSYIFGFERQRANFALDDETDTTATTREMLEAVPPGAYPSLIRVATLYAEVPYDDDAAFAFGLQLILDGLERLLERG